MAARNGAIGSIVEMPELRYPVQRLRAFFVRMAIIGIIVAIVGGVTGGVLIAAPQEPAGVLIISGIGGGGCFVFAMGVWGVRKGDKAIKVKRATGHYPV